jgi:hypothetical protein
MTVSQTMSDWKAVGVFIRTLCLLERSCESWRGHAPCAKIEIAIQKRSIVAGDDASHSGQGKKRRNVTMLVRFRAVQIRRCHLFQEFLDVRQMLATDAVAPMRSESRVAWSCKERTKQAPGGGIGACGNCRIFRVAGT